jgi:dTDP-4-dehydrorhamnose reductase
MKVVVVGSTGQLGQDLMKVFGDSAIGLTHDDLEITDAVAVSSAVQSLRPDWVINTAAFHNVDACENDASKAFAVNAIGAGNIARSARAAGAGIVFFSTDYVFGGTDRERGNPHIEDDITRPLNLYGVSKRAGERMVMKSNPVHLVLRTSGLFGTATSRKGWTFPELMVTKGQTGERLRVVDDQILSPTFTSDLASKVRELIEMQAIGLYHLTNDGECSWYEFACAALRIAGIDSSIEPVPTVIPPGKATRPSYSAMTSARLQDERINSLGHWEEALEVYLHEKGLVSRSVNVI